MMRNDELASDRLAFVNYREAWNTNYFAHVDNWYADNSGSVLTSIVAR